MNGLYLCMFIVAFQSALTPLCGAAVESSEAADALYAHGNWEQALAAYKKEQTTRVGHLIRMGECAYKIKKYAEGLAYWHKALQGVYGILYYHLARKITQVEAEIGVRSGAALTPQWYCITACAAVPPVAWQVCALLLLLLLLLYIRRWYRQKRWALISLLALGVMGVSMVAWWSITYRASVSGIVSASAPLRVGPDERFNEIGVLSMGMPVHVVQKGQIKEGPVYYKIISRGRVGWTAAESVQLV